MEKQGLGQGLPDSRPDPATRLLEDSFLLGLITAITLMGNIGVALKPKS